ncbi:MAG TPA: hypothetical protein VNT26_10300 [Candidatus Sulfotelmatobacter sp.]|nr:hypothetical protein [Candidatus Sulfotelmatobacter sp.]
MRRNWRLEAALTGSQDGYLHVGGRRRYLEEALELAADQVGEAEEFFEGQILEAAFGQFGFEGLLTGEQAVELCLVEGWEGKTAVGSVHGLESVLAWNGSDAIALYYVYPHRTCASVHKRQNSS